jgi:hypothetical protein
MQIHCLTALVTFALSAPLTLVAQPVPRTADGKPDFQGIWQATSTAAADLQDHVASLNLLAGRSVVVGGEIPYQPWAAAKKAENFRDRLTADPLAKCYMPGVPRLMYMEFPFQVFQRPDVIAMAFEWSLNNRVIFMNSPHPEDQDLWTGDSRGRWEGDTLVVDVANRNGNTWFDMSGNFHSDALHIIERYTMKDRNTIHYQATIEDTKVFTRPWTIELDIQRRLDRDRLFEYSCQSEVEEQNGAFTREERTWYPGSPLAPPVAMPASEPAGSAASDAPAASTVANIRRMPDGKPDFAGTYESRTPGANQGLEKRGVDRQFLIIDQPGGKLPLQPWAAAERISRRLSERGYDDPTAHCFPAGVPRSMWVPQAFEIVQTKDYLVILFERVSWRIIPLDGRAHLPAHMRLWQGDSVGQWDGDTLVIDTANANGKTWLSEDGDIMSYAAHVVERFTPKSPDGFQYEATVTDPVVYTKPWTISFPVGLLKNWDYREAACHEEDRDLPHLKALKDAAAAKKK